MSTAKNKKEEESIIVTVNGLDIKSNTLYKVAGKVDTSAPTGLVQLGITKYPDEGAVNSVGMRFIPDETGENGVYDTGLHVNSPCYQGLSEAQRTVIVSSLKKHIVKPFEQLKGGSKNEYGLTDHNNHQFWDEYLVHIWDGMVFNTANPDHLFGLYVAMQGYHLTPVGSEGDPRFIGSDFTIKDAETAVTYASENMTNRFDATAAVVTLLKSDSKLLIQILKYLDAVPMHSLPNTTDLAMLFNTWLDIRPSNSKEFLDLFNNLTDETFKESIYLKNALVYLSSRKIVNKVGTEYSYNGQLLGKSIKAAVQSLIDEEELEPARTKILLEYNKFM